MSVKVKYKGNEILTSDTDESRKLLTSGKYLEGDVIIENTQDGSGDGYLVTSEDNGDGTQTLHIEDGFFPTETIEITENGTYDVTDKGVAEVNVQGGGEARGIIWEEVDDEGYPIKAVKKMIDTITPISKVMYGENEIPTVGGGGGINSPYSTENHKMWLELNGFTTFEFTLPSTPTANFDVPHTLGKVPEFVVVVRKDIDSAADNDIITGYGIDNPITKDSKLNVVNTKMHTLKYMPITFGAFNGTLNYNMIKVAPTATLVNLRASGFPNTIKWGVGDYYLFLK